jgi:hypothetical protein
MQELYSFFFSKRKQNSLTYQLEFTLVCLSENQKMTLTKNIKEFLITSNFFKGKWESIYVILKKIINNCLEIC